MKIVITGGGGFIGFKLAKALLARGTLAAEKIARLTLVDQAFPSDLPKDPRLATVAGDISDLGFAARAIATDTTSIFHLAAVVSGAAEADFDLGMRVNLAAQRGRGLHPRARPARADMGLEPHGEPPRDYGDGRRDDRGDGEDHRAHVGKRVSWKLDARIEAIVKTWPVRFATPRALAPGFKADPGIDAVIRDYIADESVKIG
jgi:uncharacterized protein YbjT (DUF2867 family)